MLALPLHRWLEDCYSIGSIQSAKPLTGGEWNQVFRLDCDEGAFVLRISHPTNTLEALAYEHRLLQFMSQRIPQVPAPIANYQGSTYLQWDGLLITLFPFMPGRILDLNNAAECSNAAQMLARLHQAGLEYPDLSPRPNKPPIYELDWENNHWWRWHEVEKLLHHSEAFLKTVSDPNQRACTEQIFAKRSVIAQARETLRDWVAALHKSEQTLLFAPAQRDFWCNNLLVKEGQISAVLDWDGCRAEWLVYASVEPSGISARIQVNPHWIAKKR